MQDEYPYISDEEGAGTSQLDLGPWMQVILERIWLVITLAITIGSLGAIFAFKQEDIYRATAVLYVPPEEQKVMSMEEVAREELRTQEALNTIAQRLRHTSTLLRVVRTNALANHPAFRIEGKPASEERVISQLLQMVQTKVQPKTRLIDIIAEHRDRTLVDVVANSVATQFIRENLDQNFSINQGANTVLIEEANRLQIKLEQSERALQEYKEKNKAASLEDRQNIVLESFKKVNGDYTAAKSERLQIETDMEQMKKVAHDVKAILALPSVVRDPTIQSMRGRVIDQETLVASMSSRYKPKYPKMAQALKQLEDLQNSLDQLVLHSRDLVKSAYDAAVARERSLEAAVKQAELETLALNKLSIEYNVLSRQMASDRVLYEAVLKRMKEIDLAKGLERNGVILAEPAIRPGRPYKPDRLTITLVSLLGGLLAGLGLAFFLNFVDNSVKTVDQAESLLGIPVIGAVPMDKVAIKERHRRVVLEEPHSTCAESFRSLVAAIDMTGRLEEQKIVIFASAVPGEGKTFSSVNYAITHAQKGRRTLLIDFDLRRPSVAECFSLKSEHPGVTDYLLGKNTLDGLVYPVPDVENLFVLPAGPRVPNPAEQIAKPWVKDLLEEACQKFDRVVIDTSPLNAVADTVYLLPFAKVVCLVVKCAKTPVKAIRRTVQVMQRGNVNPSGIVLNYLPERSGYGYYYYYHYYSRDGYNSKGVYGVADDENGSSNSRKRQRRAKPEARPPVSAE